MAEFATKEKVKENRTGIPAQLKERMEQRTGLSFDDVRVHYNSDKPQKLGAFAYTQGNQVEIGPGQERHLPHELGHVVQQKLGLVRANAMHSRGVAMNTEEGLERQADEIGAGGRIGISASGNNGAGVVQRYRIEGAYTFAQAPKNEKYSKVMVKNGEPASIYFEQSAIQDVQADGILSKLGIVKTEESIELVDFEEDENLQSELYSTRTFFRFGQGRIPNIGNARPYGYETIQQGQEQPLRPEKKEDKALGLMRKQDNIMGELLINAQLLQSYMLSSGVEQISARLNELTNKYIKICVEQKVSKEYIAITSLGYDIILSMYTLRSITDKLMSKPPVVIDDIRKEYERLNATIEKVPADVEQRFGVFRESGKIAPKYILPFALLLTKEFLGQVSILRERGSMQEFLGKIDNFAKSFIDKYIQLVGKKAIPPIIFLIDDICKFIMAERDIMLSLEIAIEELEYRHKQVREEVKISQLVPMLPTGCDLSAQYRKHYSSSQTGIASFLRKNMSAVHWPYHYATPVSLPGSIIGPNDRLFIEDAVGKSSDANELANAHWVAHIYGQQDNEPISRQEGTQQDELKELNCRFNQLSVRLRSIFLKKNKMGDGSSLKISYLDEENSGSLRIVVDKNILKYQFDQVTAPYVHHFEMDLAKTLADEFVQQAVNIEHMEQLKNIGENSGAYVSAATGRVYAIENIKQKDLKKGLKEVQVGRKKK